MRWGRQGPSGGKDLQEVRGAARAPARWGHWVGGGSGPEGSGPGAGDVTRLGSSASDHLLGVVRFGSSAWGGSLRGSGVAVAGAWTTATCRSCPAVTRCCAPGDDDLPGGGAAVERVHHPAGLRGPQHAPGLVARGGVGVSFVERPERPRGEHVNALLGALRQVQDLAGVPVVDDPVVVPLHERVHRGGELADLGVEHGAREPAPAPVQGAGDLGPAGVVVLRHTRPSGGHPRNRTLPVPPVSGVSSGPRTTRARRKSGSADSSATIREARSARAHTGPPSHDTSPECTPRVSSGHPPRVRATPGASPPATPTALAFRGVRQFTTPSLVPLVRSGRRRQRGERAEQARRRERARRVARSRAHEADSDPAPMDNVARALPLPRRAQGGVHR